MDCNITENYLKERGRMSKKCEIDCYDCPLGRYHNGEDITCLELECKKPDKAVTIVQKWSNAYPPKTFLDDFKEKYPNALVNSLGVPTICPKSLGYNQIRNCDHGDCVACWKQLYIEETEETEDKAK